MIDHIGIRVSDVERGIAFYTKALAPLGYELLMQFEEGHFQGAGFGANKKPDFWIQIPNEKNKRPSPSMKTNPAVPNHKSVATPNNINLGTRSVTHQRSAG